MSRPLQSLTTCAPQDGGWPDTNGTDLGYHYPVNEDSDYDGIPDWWIWHYFGNYNYNGTNLDANNNTLLTDYQNSADPNVILFSIESTNDYVNTTNVSVQLNLIGGVPSYCATFVNGAASTNWLPFTSTNLNFTLGSTDGVYDVAVGLKGSASDATETWHDYYMTLDRSAPQIVVTNPSLVNATATVIKPWLQLQGLANEQIASVSYDLSNTLGVATGQDAFVTGQSFDTNRFEFTINYFQAYDVPLATNANRITLHVTDRAGNTATTNLTVILDYTLATNPPAITLTWPQDGMNVCGSNLTIHGTMSDETGTVQATVVNGDGTTNTITGIEERDGDFWIENVPVNGTSQITVQAVDAAGNVSATNFTVKTNDYLLTVDEMPSGDDLWQATGMVYGTAQDDAVTITVNGVLVTNYWPNDDGTYGWEADGVPITRGGTAAFTVQVQAQLLFHAAKAGGSAETSAPETDNLLVETDKAPQILTAEYHVEKTSFEDGGGSSALYTRHKDYWTVMAANPPAGMGQRSYWGWLDDHYTWVDGTNTTTQENQEMWSDTDGWASQTDSAGEDYYLPYAAFYDAFGETTGVPDEDLLATGTAGQAAPIWVYHYCAEGASYEWNSPAGRPYDHRTFAVTAHTVQVLHTGGKAVAGKKSLFCLNVGAMKYGWDSDGNWYGNDLGDRTQLQCAGKHAGADGNLWLALPDGAAQDVTVKAPASHYNAWVYPQKYPVYINLTTSTVNADLSPTNVPEVCVGQKVDFSLKWDQTTPPYVFIDNLWWHLPDKFVNQMTNYSTNCITYVKNQYLLENESVECWYVNQPGGTCSVRGQLHFPNGQSVYIGAVGDFTVFRPDVNPPVNYGPFGAGIGIGDFGFELNLMNKIMDFDVTIKSKYSGVFGLTQLVNFNALPPGLGRSTGGSFWLDRGEYYDGPRGKDQICTIEDTPGVPLLAFYGSYNGNWKTYVRFTPDGGIPVTLNRIDWNWNASATGDPSGGFRIWTDHVDDPQLYYDDNFPVWSQVKIEP